MSFVGLVWDEQRVPERVYQEARAAKASRRPALSVVEVSEPSRLRFDLADEADLV